jgi:N-acetylmuramoyl-L-alanine amidase
MKRASILFYSGVALMAASLLYAEAADRAELYVGQKLVGSFRSFQVIGDTVFLPLHESARALGIEGFADSQSKSVFFRSKGALVFIDSEKKQVQTKEGVTGLKHAPIWTGDEVYIPHVVYTEVLSDVLGETIRVEYKAVSFSGAKDSGHGNDAASNSPANGSALRNPVDVIVIDPGHGGGEAGATDPSGLLEKDVTLAIAQKLRDRLLAEGGLSVSLTREGDTEVALSDRPRKAKELNADVFISIHANGFKMISAHGFETFFASLTATDHAAMDLAIWENQVEEGEMAAPDRVMTDIEMILGDMAQTESLADSQALAEKIQNEMATVMKSENRGVKQAPFKVLMDSSMPAVLVEVGFLTSPSEAKLITDPGMQRLIVEALAAAILKYRDQTNARLGLAPKE